MAKTGLMPHAVGLRPHRKAAPAPVRSLDSGCRLLSDGVLLAPTEQCLLLAVDLPARRDRDIQAALAFVLEERLAEDPEQLRYAWCRDDGAIAVLVCARERLRFWSAALPEGVAPASVRVLPDVLGLPLEPGHWSLCLSGRRLLVRTGSCAGCACDLDEAPALLQVLHRQAPPARGVLLLREQGDGPEESLDELLASLGLPYHERDFLWPEAAPQGVPMLRLTELPPAAAPSTPLWLLALALVLIAALLQPGLAAWRAARMEEQHQTLKARTLSLFHEAFPDVRRVVNPRVQARQRFKALREAQRNQAGAQGLLPLMLAMGEALQNRPGMHLRNFRYHDGVLEIGIEAPAVAAVDDLKTALEAAGLQAQLVSARMPDQGDGRLAQASLKVWRP